MGWTVETLNATVDKELDTLPAATRARFGRIGELIAIVGLGWVSAPPVKHLTGPLWEIRMMGCNGMSRALYVAVRNKRVVLVRVFVKKTVARLRHI